MASWTSLAGQRDACAHEAEPAEPRRAGGPARLAGLLLAGALGMGEGRAQLAIATTNLLPGMELAPYSDVLTATGGVPLYVWSAAQGFLEEAASNSFQAVGTGTGWAQDEASWRVALPFAFPFYGSTHTQCWVESNGRIHFDGPESSFDISIPDFAAHRSVAAMWADLVTSNIYLEGDASHFTVRWNGVYWGGGGAANFSATLNADGTIRLRYGAGNGTGGLIGTSDGSGSNYVLSAWSQAGSRGNAGDLVFSPVGRMPDGLAVSPGGELAGIPTQVGTSIVTLVVEDALGATAHRALPVRVLANPNQRPVIAANDPPAGAFALAEATSRTFRVWASDPEGSNITYAWTWDGVAVGGNTSAYTVVTAWGDAGPHALRCTVSDGLWTSHVFSLWTVEVLDDNDGDGMPNAYERGYAFLDPWSAADAALDQDGDLLRNLHEYYSGTRPDLADTDGDSLYDFWEVNYGFNPLTPTGGLPDLDVEEIGYWTSANGNDQFMSLGLISGNVACVGGYAWTGSGSTGILATLDVADPSLPQTLCYTATPAQIVGLLSRGGVCDVALGYPGLGLKVVDLANPSQPVFGPTYAAGSSVSALARGSLLVGRYGWPAGIVEWYDDTGTGSVPPQVSTYQDPLDMNGGSARGLCRAGNFLYATFSPNNGSTSILRVIEIDGMNLLPRGRVPVDSESWYLGKIACWSNYVFWSSSGYNVEPGIRIVDVSDPDAPQQIAIAGHQGYEDLLVQDGHLYAWLWGELAIFRIDAGPGGPTLTPAYEGRGADDVVVSSNLIYSVRESDVHIRRNNGLIDADGDGLADGWERMFFGALTNNGAGDADGDGLSNKGEFEGGLNPNSADEDGDGLNDGLEVRVYGSDPRATDSDHDLIPDAEELVPGADGFVTRPYDDDTDSDGARDGEEVSILRDPTNPADGGLPGGLHGVVRAYGLPLPGAWVEARGASTGAVRFLRRMATDPSGAFAVDGLPAGTYVLKAWADGYATTWNLHATHRSNAAPIALAADTTLSGMDFDLVAGRNVALAKVTSTPTGAVIYLDGRPTSYVTPAVIDLGEAKSSANPGRLAPHRIAVRKPGWPMPPPIEKYGAEAETIEAAFDLQTPNARSLTVSSTPAGAEVFLDHGDASLGVTPLVLANLAGAAPRAHVVVLRKAGYLQPAPILADLTGPSNVVVDVPLAPDPGSNLTVTVQSVPPKADIYLDLLPVTNVTDTVLATLDSAQYAGEGWHSVSHTVLLRKPSYRKPLPRYVLPDAFRADYLMVQLILDSTTATDTNANQLPDQWEEGYDWTGVPPSQRGATGDADGDRASNEQEMLANTDPTNPNSTFKHTPSARPDGAYIRVTFQTVPGRRYLVQRAPDVALPWVNDSGVLTATGTTTEHLSPVAPNWHHWTFRVLVLP